MLQGPMRVSWSDSLSDTTVTLIAGITVLSCLSGSLTVSRKSDTKQELWRLSIKTKSVVTFLFSEEIFWSGFIPRKKKSSQNRSSKQCVHVVYESLVSTPVTECWRLYTEVGTPAAAGTGCALATAGCPHGHSQPRHRHGNSERVPPFLPQGNVLVFRIYPCK